MVAPPSHNIKLTLCKDSVFDNIRMELSVPPLHYQQYIPLSPTIGLDEKAMAEAALKEAMHRVGEAVVRYCSEDNIEVVWQSSTT